MPWLGDSLSNLVRCREVIWQLFKRGLVGDYKQSFLGVVWIILSPLIGVIGWLFMNYAGILNPGETGVPYPVYVICGAMIWGMFMSFYTACAMSLSSVGGLMLQFRFPREALVAQQIAQGLVSVGISMVLVLLLLLAAGIWPTWTAIAFPLSLIPLLLLATGIGLVTSIFAAIAHDVTKVVGVLLGLLMFLTPVIYSPDVDNATLQSVIRLNPLTYLVGVPRDILLRSRIDHVAGYLGSMGVGVVVFVLGWRLFVISEQRIAENL
jgi:lipopolysaccharide transport system permease protein